MFMFYAGVVVSLFLACVFIVGIVDLIQTPDWDDVFALLAVGVCLAFTITATTMLK